MSDSDEPRTCEATELGDYTLAAFRIDASRAFLSTFDESEAFKQVVMFWAAGLFVSVLSLVLPLLFELTSGLDLSPGLF